MSTPADRRAARRRAVVVLARHSAAAAAPRGVDPDSFAKASLADSYEVAASLDGVLAGTAGGPPEVLWPGALELPELSPGALAARLTGVADELVLLPADLPDLPALVLAKLFRVLHRVDAAVAPETAGRGTAALGLALPLAGWLEASDLDLDLDLSSSLRAAAPSRGRVLLTPGWRRLRAVPDLARLDPGLEGWEETRALLDEARR